MKTKNIILSAIIATLPFGAWAENISGAMYPAPVHETNLTPAPTTNALAPFGRVNIDTDDQSHVATTAYVKGAYNSAIAGVNGAYAALKEENIMQWTRIENTQPQLYTTGDVLVSTEVLTSLDDFDEEEGDNQLITAMGVKNAIESQRVEIYTTWDTNDTTDVAFKTVLPDD